MIRTRQTVKPHWTDGAADLSEVGTVLTIADGIASVHGLDNCMSLEMLELPHDVTGLALNLESDNVGVVLFGDWDKIEEGDTVKRTNRLLEIPVGGGLLGRIVDPLGELLATASRTESILLADVSAEEVTAVRDRFRFLQDRR